MRNHSTSWQNTSSKTRSAWAPSSTLPFAVGEGRLGAAHRTSSRLSTSAWLSGAADPPRLRASASPWSSVHAHHRRPHVPGFGGAPERAGWRHWLFVKVHTDTGLYGVGECWGWPRVVQTAIEDLKPLVVGEDPFLIERIWQKLYASTQGHGMTGVVGSGAITGIELALWDLKGKALDTPVWNLLGGKMRDHIRLYGHAFDEERAREAGRSGLHGDEAVRLAGRGEPRGEAA